MLKKEIGILLLTVKKEMIIEHLEYQGYKV